MDNIIMFRVNGLMTNKAYRDLREQFLKDMRDGIIIVDDSIKEVIKIDINHLGTEEEQ